MKHFVTSLSLFTALMIVFLTLGVLSCSANMTRFLLNREEGIAVARGTAGMNKAEEEISDAFQSMAHSCSIQSFDEMTRFIYDEGITISEEEAFKIYKVGFLNRIRKSIGDTDESLIDYLSQQLPDVKTGTITIDRKNPPFYSMEQESVYIKNINLKYKYKDVYEKKGTFDVSVPIGQIVLYDGNEEIFDYSLIGAKGIYVTGKTSTIFGNIYAGVHEPTEMRNAEALYGEKNYYGGINIMSTQVALHSDKIISEGAVNLKGSFTLFGNEEQPVLLKARDIYETDNIANKNVYALIGQYEALADDSEEKAAVEEAMEKFEEIEYYYDSANDMGYTGKYRKIISSSDVTLYDDVTGIVMTPRSVIVEEGVNVEGLIICGDRIYIQGNNNIVSSKEVLRGILKEEVHENSCIDESVESKDNMLMIHLNVTDYFGGIEYRGVK